MKVLDCVRVFFSGQHWRRQGSDGILYQIPKECPSCHTSRLSHSSSSQLFNLIIAGGFGGAGSIQPNHKISKQPWQVQSQSAWYKHPHGTNWNFSAHVHKCISALVSIRITCNPTFPVRRWRRLCPLSDLAPACASSIMSCFRVTLNLMFHPRSSILRQCGPNWKLRGRNWITIPHGLFSWHL